MHPRVFEALLTVAALMMLIGTSSTVAGDDSLEKGRRAFAKGALDDAVKAWREAREDFHRMGDARGECESGLDLAAAYERLGQIRLATQTLERALEVAEKAGLPDQELKAQAALGGMLIFSKQAERAEPVLREALGKARSAVNSEVSARVLNDLGNLLSARKQFNEAADAYGEAAELATRAKDPLLAAKAMMNRAGVAVAAGEPAAAVSLTQRALAKVRALPDSRSKATLLLSAAAHLQKVATRAPEAIGDGFAAAKHALRIAEGFCDERTKADALGTIGALYEVERRPVEGLRVTREALFVARAAQAADALYRLEWQAGRLSAARGRRTEAIAAYQRALTAVHAVRHDLAVGYGNANRGSSFREAVGPLFFQLADLLLQRSAEETDPAQIQASLREARDTVELLKSAELVDYFQDDCVNLLRSKTAGIEQISPTAAIIYLIPLPTRTVLLLGLSDGLQRFQIDVGEKELTAVIRAFRRNLETRTSYEYLTEGRKLYNWLVRPMEGVFSRHNIDTLVFVPDGAMRTIPLAALHDGEHFLISRYAVAVTPGATLTDPRTVERKAAHVLLGGLSDPVQGYLPLSFVPQEINSIRELQGGTVLLDKQFLTDRVGDKFQGEQFSIVHLASHGRFDRDAHKTFVLTHDSKMTLDDLERFIRPGQFRGRPVELVTLSACQTAAGDDRAALGMAGVAVKSGARSAVASLWFVNDQSSSELIAAFYKHLWQEPGISKAQAMQKAQLSLLETWTYRHPCYWAPYLVIGNWL